MADMVTNIVNYSATSNRASCFNHHCLLKIPEGFTDTFPTWIIAYNPYLDSFCVSNHRFFFWESDMEFQSEDNAVDYFRNHVEEFAKVREEVLGDVCECSLYEDLYLENTEEWFSCTSYQE
ncbi:MAG: hypothetical protein Q4G33_06450 [bacterium]|nr:hypothetical protein [bacterium]